MNEVQNRSIYARGKLLLTGEYAVLDGALALATPVRYGQNFEIEALDKIGQLRWSSDNEKGERWFQATFRLPDLRILDCSGTETAERLQGILLACRRQNPVFLDDQLGRMVRSRTDFPRAWGLGTSSTLIAALARWAEVDPYTLLFDSLGGSGYDVACAFAEKPLLYQLHNRKPLVQPVDFAPPFAAHLFFVFLGKKQNSRAGIRRYRELAQTDTALVEQISALTLRCLEAPSLEAFSAVLLEHENLISKTLELPRAQDLYFPDFPGVVKSLGAWGGDFVLAASSEGADFVRRYFLGKGFGVCSAYFDMILGNYLFPGSSE